MVQSTFTKQKREQAKATSWIQKLRASELRERTCAPDGALLTEVRVNYVDYPPTEIAQHVLSIMEEVVRQHGARQQANSTNLGRFSWRGVEAQLSVPQLRALREAHIVFADLVRQLPRRNARAIPNGEVDGYPAFFDRVVEHKEIKVRYVPFEEEDTTRVRTYEEKYEELKYTTQQVTIDYGLGVRSIQHLEEMVNDLGTAIQIAIDDANAKGHKQDELLEGIISKICAKFHNAFENPK